MNEKLNNSMKPPANCPRGSDVFSKLAECKTTAEFKEKILSVIKQFGFTDFSFSGLAASPTNTTLTTLPDQVREFYLKNDIARHDFFMEHAESSSTPIYLSTLKQFIADVPFSSERIYRNENYHKLLASLGYQDSYCVPHSFGRDSRRALFMLFAKDSSQEDFRRRVEQCQLLLPMVVGAVAYFGFTHFHDHFLDMKLNGQMAVTPKPLKMLETVAKEGLLLKEAASKLKISLDTANKHVAAIKQALGATTLANAVYLAMVHGLLTEEEEASGTEQ